jgi:phage FluMu gp28-like protein
VVRCTLDDAIAQGLYERICLMTGRNWTPEAEAEWRAGIYKVYGADADEELRCIPSLSSGAFLSRALIEARMDPDVPVFRWKAPPGFVDWPETLRKAEAIEWCRRDLLPVMSRLNERWRSCFGMDFARSGDLSVLHPMQIEPGMRRASAFILELADMPFETQREIVFWIARRLPRFFHGAFDATGNGAYLAEVARQRFGAALISEIKFTADWYIQNMPRLKAAFEDGTITLPRDDDIGLDYRSIRVQQGVPKVQRDETREGTNGWKRHGDAAVAGVLAWYASCQESGEARIDPLPIPSPDRAPFLSALGGGLRDSVDLTDFTRF